MKDSRLIQLISTLNRRQMTRFREYAESPYHNKHQEVRKLVQFLSCQFPGFDAQKVDRRHIFCQILPDHSFDYHKLSVFFSYTVRLLESFFSQEAFDADGAAQNQYLLSRLRDEGQTVLYQKKLREVRRKLLKEDTKNGSYHLKAFGIFREGDLDYRIRAEHEWDQNLPLKQEHLDNFFISEKLKDHCELLIRKRILRGAYENHLLPEILNHVAQRLDYFEQVPAVIIYYRLYQLLQGANNQSLEDTLSKSQELDHFFIRTEQEELYNMLLNYCIARINEGQNTYHAKALRIIRWQLEKGLIFNQGYFPEWHYKNIVTIGIRANEKAWVFDFIEKYKANLHPNCRSRAYSFNLASYYYSVGLPDKALDLLAHLEYHDPRYYIATKALLLRTYFDLQEYEALKALSESFQQQMKRNKRMTDARVRGLSNLFKFTKRAMTIQIQSEYRSALQVARDLEKLKLQIQETEELINRSWLEEKISEIREKLGISVNN